MPFKQFTADTNPQCYFYRAITDRMDECSYYLNDFYTNYMIEETSNIIELKCEVEEVLQKTINMNDGKTMFINAILNTIDFKELLELLIDYVKEILLDEEDVEFSY